MKKILLALCLCTLSLGAFAQNQGNNQQRGQRTRRTMDAVIDTTIINRMQLPTATIEQVLALQKTKQEEMQEMMKTNRPERGKRMSESEREQMRKQRKEFTSRYRADLRRLMGDDAYIAYLELLVDSRQAMGMNRPQGQMGGHGGNHGPGNHNGGFGNNSNGFNQNEGSDF